MSQQITPINQGALRQLLDHLLKLRQEVMQQAQARLLNYTGTDKTDHPDSAVNLAQYLALRGYDLRVLQDQLTSLGLSSLGNGEAGIVDNLNRIINLLCWVLNDTPPLCILNEDQVVSSSIGRLHLKHNNERLFGNIPEERGVHVMVTLPNTAAHDYELIQELINNGMNCARINCAHDDQNTWAAMINHVRRASEESGKECRIMMDLAGQKIRTGSIEPGPKVYHLKIKRDELGNVKEPGFIQLLPNQKFNSATQSQHFQLAIDDDIHSDLDIGDRLNFVDLRGKHRHLEITSKDEQGFVLGRCWQNAYLSDQTKFQWRHKGKKKTPKHQVDIPILGFKTLAAKIRVYKGDSLLLTSDNIPGAPSVTDKEGKQLEPAHIGISHSEILPTLSPGATAWIDDGKIGAIIESVSVQGVLLKIEHVRSKGALIREDKGVNFPDTELKLPALTDKDLQDLDFVCEHADIVAYSFVQSHDDMQKLLSELKKRNAERFPVIAKIETHKAVKNLPEIILSALDTQPFGIMIARGDLAIELGSVRMAEIQEEILWLCEAAHVPVVWATQVLETLAKEGIRSRPEVTDAAMSVRAECVMLNKGPYILETLAVLNDILTRMQAHQRKKSSRLRALHQWTFTSPTQQQAVS